MPSSLGNIANSLERAIEKDYYSLHRKIRRQAKEGWVRPSRSKRSSNTEEGLFSHSSKHPNPGGHVSPPGSISPERFVQPLASGTLPEELRNPEKESNCPTSTDRPTEATEASHAPDPVQAATNNRPRMTAQEYMALPPRLQAKLDAWLKKQGYPPVIEKSLGTQEYDENEASSQEDAQLGSEANGGDREY